jgi:hypothetical protein
MDPGLLALIGIFVLAAVCATWNWRRQRSIERKLRALGFEPCPAAAPGLLEAWRAITRPGGDAPGRDLRVGACLRRAGGWGLVHWFMVTEVRDDGSDERANVGASYAAYLLDLPDSTGRLAAPVTLLVLPPGSRLLRGLARRTLELDPPGHPLAIGEHAWTSTIVAAYGASEGKLDAQLPPALQEKLARASEHGFFWAHLGGGKLGLAVLPGHADVDAQARYLAEWV